MEYLVIIILLLLINQYIYDKYVQRKHQLLINYPILGRMRYLFEALREPFRQYFGDEDFYESKDKVDWVYNAAKGQNGYVSFSPNQPQPNPKFLIKHANAPLNDDEVEQEFRVTFGAKREHPFVASSIIGRSAMSDGAMSPEATRAFAKGAYDGDFPINSGEGSLTTNFFITHRDHHDSYMNRIEITGFDKALYSFIKTTMNRYVAIKMMRARLLGKDEADTYIFDPDGLVFYRPNWNAPLEHFPKEVPADMPDITFQMSSGLYGVRDSDGNFDEDRYLKTMSFCRMTEIKLAQGAKQTGGKLIGSKVTPAVAYYRGVKAGESVFSPNRFPYARSVEELFDFVDRLQKLSKKPVGFKIVVSSKESVMPYVYEMRRRKAHNLGGIPDFITIDGGDGGSATAPLFLMDRVGFHIKDAIHIVDTLLKEYGVRDELKLIASSKILTPDDVIITMALGADFINIGRGFMLAGGCIRARMCSGEGSHHCPVGMATQDPKRRQSYLVYKQAEEIKNYHAGLLKGVKTTLAVMGIKRVEELTQGDLTFIDKNGFIYADINRYFDKKLNV
jgi:glutamate synthase domain-containing protein 2